MTPRAIARLEDEADIAIYDARKARLAGNEADKLPLEVSTALLKGDSLLKALRDWREMTQAEIADTAGIGQGYYSEIEKGARRGSQDVLTAIARALDVPASWLV